MNKEMNQESSTNETKILESEEDIMESIKILESEEDIMEFLAENEYKIKAFLPAQETHVKNLDFPKLITDIESLGVVLSNPTALQSFLSILYDYGFFEYITDYSVVRNDKPIFEMLFEA